VIKNMLKQLDIAVKNEKSYSELLCIVEKLTQEGVPLELTIGHLRHLSPQISDRYDDELGDLIQDIECGKHKQLLKIK